MAGNTTNPYIIMTVGLMAFWMMMMRQQGGGGGKPAMAQAGGKNAAGIDDALEAARKMLL